MGSWDIRLIGASYKKMENDLAIHLYGKTQDGRSIVAKFTGFEPYFFYVEPDSENLRKQIADMLENDDRIRRLEDAELLYKGEMRKCRKVVATYPWLVPDIRKTIMPSTAVLAADIPFHFRFVYDMDMGSCVRVIGEEFEDRTYRTDIVVKAERFEPIKPFRPRLRVLSFDVETSLKEPKIFTICCYAKDGGEVTSKRFFGDERRMFEDFSKFIDEYDPDVITGYNIDGFDIPQILQRLQALRMQPPQWGRYPGT